LNDSARGYVMQLEEESGIQYSKILEDDRIQISNCLAGGTLVDIQTFVLNGGLKIWKRGYPEIIGKHGKFSKSKKFTEQAETKKVVSRMIVKYFFAELVKNEAITTTRVYMTYLTKM
jgi:hypothetical protein